MLDEFDDNATRRCRCGRDVVMTRYRSDKPGVTAHDLVWPNVTPFDPV